MEKSILQDKIDKLIDCLTAWGCPSTKSKIWFYIDCIDDSPSDIYENFYEVLNSLEVLNTLVAEEDKIGDIIGKFKISRTNLESSQTLKECITTMLRKSFQTEINQEITENLYFLTQVVPKYLEGKNKHLLFENLWEILKELGFSEDQICSVWGLSLCPILEHPSYMFGGK